MCYNRKFHLCLPQNTARLHIQCSRNWECDIHAFLRSLNRTRVLLPKAPPTGMSWCHNGTVLPDIIKEIKLELDVVNAICAEWKLWQLAWSSKHRQRSVAAEPRFSIVLSSWDRVCNWTLYSFIPLNEATRKAHACSDFFFQNLACVNKDCAVYEYSRTHVISVRTSDNQTMINTNHGSLKNE